MEKQQSRGRGGPWGTEDLAEPRRAGADLQGGLAKSKATGKTAPPAPSTKGINGLTGQQVSGKEEKSLGQGGLSGSSRLPVLSNRHPLGRAGNKVGGGGQRAQEGGRVPRLLPHGPVFSKGRVCASRHTPHTLHPA